MRNLKIKIMLSVFLLLNVVLVLIGLVTSFSRQEKIDNTIYTSLTRDASAKKFSNGEAKNYEELQTWLNPNFEDDYIYKNVDKFNSTAFQDGVQVRTLEKLFHTFSSEIEFNSTLTSKYFLSRVILIDKGWNVKGNGSFKKMEANIDPEEVGSKEYNRYLNFTNTISKIEVKDSLGTNLTKGIYGMWSEGIENGFIHFEGKIPDFITFLPSISVSLYLLKLDLFTYDETFIVNENGTDVYYDFSDGIQFQYDEKNKYKGDQLTGGWIDKNGVACEGLLNWSDRTLSSFTNTLKIKLGVVIGIHSILKNWEFISNNSPIMNPDIYQLLDDGSNSLYILGVGIINLSEKYAGTKYYTYEVEAHKKYWTYKRAEHVVNTSLEYILYSLYDNGYADDIVSNALKIDEKNGLEGGYNLLNVWNYRGSRFSSEDYSYDKNKNQIPPEDLLIYSGTEDLNDLEFGEFYELCDYYHVASRGSQYGVDSNIDLTFKFLSKELADGIKVQDLPKPNEI